MNLSKKVLKWLSTLLAILVVVGILPLSTIAADVNESISIKDAIESDSSETDKSSEIITEVESSRDEYTKVFKKADGSYTAIISAAPLHYEEDGEWIDIDNTLVEKTVDGKEKFVNKSNEFTVELPREMSKDSDVTIKKDDFELSFELELPNIKNNNGKAIGKVKNGKTEMSKGNSKAVKFAGLEKKNSKVTYENISENTSIEYNVTPSGLKENIVIDKKPKSEVTYTYNIKAENLIAEKNEDGSIDFYASDNIVFSIPAPVMFDAKGNESTDTNVGFSGDKGKYKLTYTPSYVWLKNNAKYPVTIDPIIDTNAGNYGVYDTYVDSEYPNDNNCDDIFSGVGKIDGEDYITLINPANRFVFESGVVIKSVTLNLNMCVCNYSGNSLYIEAHPITSDWNVSNVTYNTIPNISSAYLDKDQITDTATHYTFDVTEAYIGDSEAKGIALMQSAESPDSLTVFYSSEYSELNPYFEIEYYDTAGVNNAFDYHYNNLGRAGEIYVNDFTNQVYIQREELGINTTNMPVQIKRYFNSSYSTLSINNLIFKTFLNAYGFGWGINYSQFIEYYPDFHNGEDRILYMNEQGQIVYFEMDGNTPSDGKYKWKECSYQHINDTGCTLYVPENYVNDISANLQYVTIVDSSGRRYEFNNIGFLVKICANENESGDISITYSDVYIDKITDGIGKQYKFNYTEMSQNATLLTSIQVFNADNTPVKVKNDLGAEVDYKYIYDYEIGSFSGENLYSLKSVTYPDGKTVNYEITSDSVLAKNIDGLALYCGKTQNNHFTVRERAYTTNNNYVTGNYLDISNNGVYEKTFDDRDGNVVTKQFDIFGRTTCVIDDNSITPYSYESDEDESGEVYNILYNSLSSEQETETNLLVNGDFSTSTAGWTVSNSSCVARSPYNDYDPNATEKGALLMLSSVSGIRTATQTIEIDDGVSGDGYILTGWAKSDLAHSSIDDLKWYLILVEARKNNDGTEDWETVTNVEFNPYNHNWHVASRYFNVDTEYNELRVTIYYVCQYGSACFDELSLINQYKASNNTSGSHTDDEGETDNRCSCPNCIDPFCTCTGENCSENCTRACCNRGYSFDNNNNTFSISVNDSQQCLKTSGTIGNYGAVRSNNYNNITNLFSYNSGNGQLENTTDGNGVISTYTYNAMNALTSVSKAVSGLSDNTATMSTQYSYNNDRISSITHNGFSYNYEYDVWGNVTSVKIGNSPLVSYEYFEADNNPAMWRDTVEKIEYANGDYTQYSYNFDNLISNIRMYDSNNNIKGWYQYNYENGELISVKDKIEKIETSYSDGNITVTYLNDLNNESDDYIVYSTSSDETSDALTECFAGQNFTISESNTNYDVDSGITTTTAALDMPNNRIEYTSLSDYFGRQKSNSFSILSEEEDEYSVYLTLSQEYTYKSFSEISGGRINNRTTSLVDTYKSSIVKNVEVAENVDLEDATEELNETVSETEYHYSYDSNGNMTRIFLQYEENGEVEQETVSSYEYDEAGQLVRENNALIDKTIVCEYDSGGNITKKSEYEFSETAELGTAENIINYSYDSTWKDKMVFYGNTGISYDVTGNPLNYISKNINGDSVTGTLEWNGRVLEAVETEDYRFEYTYDSDGNRIITRKFDDDGNLTVAYKYIWDNGRLAGYMICDDEENIEQSVKMLYNNLGASIGYVATNPENDSPMTFLFEKNLQGNITGVYDNQGDIYIYFLYDAWGNISMESSGSGLSAALKAVLAVMLTPITYRGYMYDFETGLYYLKSRYYNPEYGRFLNMDSVDILNANPTSVHCANLFAYCNNNPIVNVDFDGGMPKPLLNSLLLFSNFICASSELVAALVIMLNKSIYTAFHEMAQIFVGMALIKKGYNVVLEKFEHYSFRLYKMDVVYNSCFDTNINYVYEIKPEGKSAKKQIDKYTKISGYYYGRALSSDIYKKVFENVSMKIRFDGMGGAYYSFIDSLTTERITNKEMRNKILLREISFNIIFLVVCLIVLFIVTNPVIMAQIVTSATAISQVAGAQAA